MKKRIITIFFICTIIVFGTFIVNLLSTKKSYQNYVIKFSEQYNLDKSLVYAVIKVESNFNKNATSSAGAKGLMQIIPTTAKWIATELGYDFSNIDLYDPETNINFGCFYLNYLKSKFSDLGLLICAYNAGESVVKNWTNKNNELDESKITYPETLNYYKKVIRYYNIYSKNEIGE